MTNKYSKEGAKEGDRGYIIEQYDERYEVEFSDNEGATIVLIVVEIEDIVEDEPQT